MTPSESLRIFVPIFRRSHLPTYAVCAVVWVGAVVALVVMT